MRDRGASRLGDIFALALILSDDEPATLKTPEELAAEGVLKPLRDTAAEAKDRAARVALDGTLPKRARPMRSLNGEALEYLSQVPLAIAPRYLGYLMSVLQGRFSAVPVRTPMLRGQALSGTAVVDSIAVVPIIGPIVQRPDLFDRMFGAVSPGDIRSTVGAAIEDPNVSAVLLVVDSPGGEVAGIADLADALFAARGRKPMVAVADEGTFSAAYWIASAVGPIALPRTGSVGSIGVLAMHQDVTGMLENLGVKISVIKSGAKKAQFSPFEQLSPSARASMQAEVDRLASMFFDAVARHRGLTATQVAELEGGTLEGPAAVAGGLADQVATVDDAYLALRMSLLEARTSATNVGGSREKELSMAAEINPPVSVPTVTVGSGTAPVVTPRETLEAPPPPPATPWQGTTNVVSIEAARKQARDEAAVSERKRAAEIMSWCAFVGRADMAEQFTASNLTVEDVRNELAKVTAGMSFTNEIHGARSMNDLHGRRLDTVEEIYERRRATVREAKRYRYA